MGYIDGTIATWNLKTTSKPDSVVKPCIEGDDMTVNASDRNVVSLPMISMSSLLVTVMTCHC